MSKVSALVKCPAYFIATFKGVPLEYFIWLGWRWPFLYNIHLVNEPLGLKGVFLMIYSVLFVGYYRNRVFGL